MWYIFYYTRVWMHSWLLTLFTFFFKLKNVFFNSPIFVIDYNSTTCSKFIKNYSKIVNFVKNTIFLFFKCLYYIINYSTSTLCYYVGMTKVPSLFFRTVGDVMWVGHVDGEERDRGKSVVQRIACERVKVIDVTKVRWKAEEEAGSTRVKVEGSLPNSPLLILACLLIMTTFFFFLKILFSPVSSLRVEIK